MSLLTSLLAYWKMDESSGNAFDSQSVGPYTLVESGGSLASTGGFFGNARAGWGDGAGPYLLAPTAILDGIGSGDFTFAGWIYPDTTLASYRTVFAQVGNSVGFFINSASDGYVRFPGWLTSVTFSPSFSINAWQHVAVTRAGSVLTIYRNATIVYQYLTALSGSVSGTFSFGYDLQGGGTHWNGPLDEWGVWGRELSATEVGDLYNGGAGLPYSSFGGGGGAATPAPTPIFGYINNPVAFGF